jgi:F0F1-type ATP synthase membrane subunit b/b'
MIQLNATFFVVLLSFLAFVALLRHLFFAPLQSILAQRQQALGGSQEGTDTALQEYMGLEAGHEAKVHLLKQGLQAQLHEAHEAEAAKHAAVLQEAKAAAAERLAALQQQLAAEQQQALIAFQALPQHTLQELAQPLLTTQKPLAV